MKIKEYKGYGEYVPGISKYGVSTSVYLFNVKETGYVNEEGQKEKSYLLYEFPSSVPLQSVRDVFLSDYLDHVGYTEDKELRIMTQSGVTSTADLSDMLYAKLEAYGFAEGIYKPSTLQYAVEKKILEIDAYYNSDKVNGFELSGMTMWLDPTLRGNIQRQIDSARILNKDSISISIAGEAYKFSLDSASYMLATLEMYASECYNIRDGKIASVKKITSVPDVDSYSATDGYPVNPKFEI